ncbi:MAG: hypothetical protein FIB01_06005 [Gemmatimonadetes bacterium]|nr:hypothetical protein [Gemmatimonadota bacterium]
MKVAWLGILFALAALASPADASAQQRAAGIHGRLRLQLECTACHTPAGWRPLRSDIRFDHEAQTGFPLTGRHATASCATCHRGLRFDQPRAAANDCVSCHVDVHQGRLSQQCAECHTTASFAEASRRDFHSRTAFPLTGPHAAVPCDRCHRTDVGGAFAALPTACVSCHRQDFQAAHGAGGFPEDCLTCHQSDRWSGASFDHAARAHGFALVGAHATGACNACHIPPGYRVRWTPASQNDCVACHRSDYDAKHAGSGFPSTCTLCHTVQRWGGASFDHATVARGYALVGAPAAEPCTSCHIPPGNQVRWTPASQNDCVACHRSDYDAKHAGSGYPTTCTSCHDVNRWQGAVFNHATASGGFALAGAHAAAPCSSCHLPPDRHVPWTPAGPNDCVACHRADYDAAHAGFGFPTTCTSCHSVDRWQGVTFNHATASGGFALLGAHAAEPCSSCHVPPDQHVPWTPAGQNDCVACHRAAYDAHHAGSGYPTTCITCHTVTAWTGATFNHDAQFFPIYSGKHAGKWSSCLQCHPSSADFGVFSCLTCHTRTGTDADHRQVSGYAYDSARCLACHPRGD